MGYSYGYGPGGRMVLACDKCGAARGNTRKVKCPHGYCQAAALCACCRADPAVRQKLNAYHEEHCRKASAKWKAELADRQRKLDSGAFVLCSALQSGPDRVHALFRNAAGEVRGFYMPNTLYNPRLPNANPTPEEFAALGTLEQAPTEFNYQRST